MKKLYIGDMCNPIRISTYLWW